MLSELQAVNTMLSAIGSAPVNSISGQVSSDVAAARNILEESRLDVLLVGWAFNTDRNVVVAPQSGTKKIQVPADTLRMDVSPGFYTTVDPVQRGGWLYDRKNATYTFGASLEVDIIRDLSWDTLPLVARRYITARATRVMVARFDGGEQAHAYALQDERVALTALQQNETDTGDYTIFDNQTAYDILHRGL